MVRCLIVLMSRHAFLNNNLGSCSFWMLGLLDVGSLDSRLLDWGISGFAIAGFGETGGPNQGSKLQGTDERHDLDVLILA